MSFDFHKVLLSFGQTFWIQSVQYEVFTLNNLFITIVLYLTVRFYYFYWRDQNQHRICVPNSVPNSVPNRMLWSLYRRSFPLQSAHDCFLLVPNHPFHPPHIDQITSAQLQTFFPTRTSVSDRTITLFVLSYRFLLPQKGQLGRCTHLIW